MFIPRLSVILIVASYLLPFICDAQTMPSLKEMDSIIQYRGHYSRYSPQNRPSISSRTTARPGYRQTQIKRPALKTFSAYESAMDNVYCKDTSLRIVYTKGPGKNFSNDYITKTKDGNILIPGFDTDLRTTGHLIKCTQRGDTLWSKTIAGGYSNRSFDVYNAFELNDETILLAGNMDIPMPYNGRSDLLIVRVSATGDLLWEKTFKTKLWNKDTTSGSIVIRDCKQDADGNLYLAGYVIHYGASRQSLAFKMDLSGNILWSKGFGIGFSPSLSGINIIGQKVTFVGDYVQDNGIVLLGVVMDAASGDTLSSKILLNSHEDFWTTFYKTNVVKLDNGNLAIGGRGISSGYTFDPSKMLTHTGLLEVTPDLHFVRSVLFRSYIPSNLYNTVMSVFEDGSASYTRLNYISGYTADIIYGNYKNGQILKERIIPYRGIGVGWVSNFLQSDDGGQIITSFIGDSVQHDGSIEFLRLNNSDTASECFGKDTLATFLEPANFIDGRPYFDSISNDVVTEDPRPFEGIFYNDFLISNLCNQVNHCDSINISVPDDTICVNTGLTIQVKKNKACGAIPLWEYDTAVVKDFDRINDSTFHILFKSSWQGYIRASINGCKEVADSFPITVLREAPLLDLGTDTVICPENIIKLNARNGFTTYRWQDGSRDSVYNVVQPGKYFVTVTDVCSGIFSDTIIVAPHAPIDLDAGPNRIICQNDTVHLTATPGFLNYEWTTDNFIDVPNLPIAVASPVSDILYFLKAEKEPGCFAFDTVFIKVNHSIPITIGRDTSFCTGDSITLDAGNNFAALIWNTGATTPSITVKNAGEYYVDAVSTDGCHSFDTMVVRNIFPLPGVKLDRKPYLCTGSTRILDAGDYSSFLWNDGSEKRTLEVSEPGTYYVAVTDNNHCKGSDTTVINTMAPLPSAFMPGDTAICSYEKIVVHAKPGFSDYLWSNGANKDFINIDQPGLYWLQVTDDKNCTGKEYMQVTLKDCMKGFFIPSAFTPNGDGKNDIFKPLIFGRLDYFSFKVYNRFGQKIFESDDPTHGWDGRFQNLELPSDIFTWTCSFQIMGEKAALEKGTVMLMR